jgi:hypothetical protein
MTHYACVPRRKVTGKSRFLKEINGQFWMRFDSNPGAPL